MSEEKLEFVVTPEMVYGDDYKKYIPCGANVAFRLPKSGECFLSTLGKMCVRDAASGWSVGHPRLVLTRNRKVITFTEIGDHVPASGEYYQSVGVSGEMYVARVGPNYLRCPVYSRTESFIEEPWT